MKVDTPQIAWHGRDGGKNDPILSADLHESGILATGGADNEVKASSSQRARLERLPQGCASAQIWRLDFDGAAARLAFVAGLQGHQKTVNVVRFSPDGALPLLLPLLLCPNARMLLPSGTRLASGSDGALRACARVVWPLALTRARACYVRAQTG